MPSPQKAKFQTHGQIVGYPRNCFRLSGEIELTDASDLAGDLSYILRDGSRFTDHQEFSHRQPSNEGLQRLNEILADGIVDDQENYTRSRGLEPRLKRSVADSA